MTHRHARSMMFIGVAVALGTGLACAGSQHSWRLGVVPAFALAVLLAFLAQWIAFVPAAISRTDRYFDATGSLTYILVTAALLALGPEPDARRLLVAGMVIIWAARLGTFLLIRNVRSGGDDRFADIRVNPVRFFSVWTVQGLWVSLTAAAAWIALSSSHSAPLTWVSWAGLSLWAVGFAIEVIADEQKRRFRANPTNEGRFINSGLWAVVRHPNYLGEILLWVGVLCVVAPVLQGWQWVALLSPLFVIVLLTRVSGIPLLEAKAERRWGEDPGYRAYLARTPKLVPFPRRGR